MGDAMTSQTSSVCHGDTVPEPVGRLGDVVTLDTYPGPSLPGAGAPASTTRVQPRAVEPRLVLPSVRMRWVDDLLDDLAFAAGWGVLALLALLVGFVVAVRVFGGAA